METESGDGAARVIRIIQPTYKTEPELDGRFVPAQVERHCEPILRRHLEEFTWDTESRTNNTMAARGLVNAIMTCVSELELSRYKIVVQLSLGENMGQAVRVGSQSLWESTLDNTAEVSFSNQSVWASLVIIGFYVH